MSHHEQWIEVEQEKGGMQGFGPDDETAFSSEGAFA